MRVRLLLALHFHQPVGNFDSVFRDAVRLCYAPLVEQFQRHPGVGAAFHLSGCLLEWLENHDRCFLDRVLALVAGGRIEPLGGGFYEPILPAIPRTDALEQIGRLAAWWERRAGARPRGAWVAERVWEPGLAELLAEAGVRYTILDDQHLRFAGLLDERFSGAFVTERAGRSVAFFPSDFQLRYMIPFRTVEALRQHFRDLPADRPEWVLTYGDDAEKFGLWPGTNRWVHGEGWLDKFLSFLEEGTVRAQPPGAYLDERPPARKVYVPNASYTEMLEWALPAASAAAYGRTRAAALAGAPAEEVRAFVRGSLWDMFLARYPEADQLHKHVLWTSRRVRALPEGAGEREAALTAVLRSECNCPYWHGLFGGVYFPHLRHGAYQSVLEADALLAGQEGGGVRVEVEDLDGDLEPELVLRCAQAQAFFRPGDAGTLAELDYLPARFNVANVMSRWREAYHQGADLTHGPAAAAGLASPHERPVGLRAEDLAGKHFDSWPLRSLRDFWSAARPDPERLSGFEGMEVALGRLGRWEKGADGFRSEALVGPLRCARQVRMEDSGALVVSWELDGGGAGESPAPGARSGGAGSDPAPGPRPDGAPLAAGGGQAGGAGGDLSGWFGTLLCLTLLTPEAPDRALLVEGRDGERLSAAPGKPLQRDEVRRVSLEDRAHGFAIDLEPTPAARLVTAPVETLQRSEDRVEPIYQGTLFALCWALPRPGPGKPGAGKPGPAEPGPDKPGRENLGPGLRLSFRRLT